METMVKIVLQSLLSELWLYVISSIASIVVEREISGLEYIVLGIAEILLD
jgi:hypothetical protein